MEPVALQFVLDRFYEMFRKDISPRIIRNSMDYIKECSCDELPEHDGDAGTTALMMRGHAYLAGYCNFVDGFYDEKVTKGMYESSTADIVLDDIAAVHGEVLPTWMFVRAKAYINSYVLTQVRTDDDDSHIRTVAYALAKAYMEGVADAKEDFESHYEIKSIHQQLTKRILREALDESSLEPILDTDDKKEDLYASAVRAFTALFNTKSGYDTITIGGIEQAMLLYAIGFLEGYSSNTNALTCNEKEKATDSQESYIRRYLAYWCDAMGYGAEVFERALTISEKREDELSKNASEEARQAAATVLGVGACDGIIVKKRQERDELSEEEMMDAELDEIFSAVDLNVAL